MLPQPRSSVLASLTHETHHALAHADQLLDLLEAHELLLSASVRLPTPHQVWRWQSVDPACWCETDGEEEEYPGPLLLVRVRLRSPLDGAEFRNVFRLLGALHAEVLCDLVIHQGLYATRHGDFHVFIDYESGTWPDIGTLIWRP